MNDLFYYLDLPQKGEYTEGTIGNRIIDFNDETNADCIDVYLLIYSTKEFLQTAISIKTSLFHLFDHSDLNMCDLGSAKLGNSDNDSDASISFIFSSLKQTGKKIVLIGDKELTTSQLLNYPEISCVSNRIEPLKVNSNVNYIGSQIYLTSNDILNNCLENPLINIYRLGELKKDITKIEPCLRDTGFSIFQLDSLEGSHIYSKFGSPVGFSIHDVCQIAFYIGQSNNNSVVYFGGKGIDVEACNQEKEFSLILWHYLFGLKHRIIPDIESSNLKSYHLAEIHEGLSFTFYEDVVKNFWWLKIESDTMKKIIASSSDEHTRLLSGEISPRILRAIS